MNSPSTAAFDDEAWHLLDGSGRPNFRKGAKTCHQWLLDHVRPHLLPSLTKPYLSSVIGFPRLATLLSCRFLSAEFQVSRQTKREGADRDDIQQRISLSYVLARLDCIVHMLCRSYTISFAICTSECGYTPTAQPCLPDSRPIIM